MSDAHDERRDLRRIEVELAAILSAGATSIGCTVVNLTSLGAKIRLAGPFAVERDITLAIDGLGESRGVIVWRLKDQIGIAFEQRSQEIVDYLKETEDS